MATNNFNDAAKTYLGGARSAIADLERIREGHHDPRTVAQLYDRINQGMKLAEVCGLIAIADRLEDVVEQLDDGRLSLDEADQVLQERAS